MIRLILEAYYDVQWSCQSHGFRPERGCHTALRNIHETWSGKLDTFVETVLIPRYTKGIKRRANAEYTNLIARSCRHRKRGNTRAAQELKQVAQRMPSKDVNDPGYRRLKYVRYADDFLLGFVGPRSEAEEIKHYLRKFLRDERKA